MQPKGNTRTRKRLSIQAAHGIRPLTVKTPVTGTLICRATENSTALKYEIAWMTIVFCTAYNSAGTSSSRSVRRLSLVSRTSIRAAAWALPCCVARTTNDTASLINSV